MEDTKMLEQETKVPGDESIPQCKFYLKKKSRLCRFRPKPGQQYCPEHACIMGVPTARKRIPCPLNPKHNCYEDELEKHKRKCNVTKIQEKVAKEVFYVKGVNKGKDECQDCMPVEAQVSVRDLTSEDLAKMIEKVHSIYKAHVDHIESSLFQHPCVQDEICCSGEEDICTILKDQAALRKELMQQAGLIGQMAREKFLDNQNSCFVELGAGKGKLSHWIRKASSENSKSKYLLVERSSVRYKVDGHQKQHDGDINFKRIKMDIEDLYLGKVPELQNVNKVFVVGKHLCGGATDMGIRCAVNTLTSLKEQPCPQNSLENQSLPVEQRQGHNTNCALPTDQEDDRSSAKHSLFIEPPVKIQRVEEPTCKEISRLPKGIMIALCCHHQCTWDTYVGKSFMKDCGIGPREFDLLTRLSSWATCARVRVTSNTNPSNGLQTSVTSSRTLNQASHRDESSTTTETEGAEKDHCSKDLVNLTKTSSQALREQLSISERERIGRQCKRIIDTGRLHYLRSKGMKAWLREYIDEFTTPENVVLVACQTEMKDICS